MDGLLIGLYFRRMVYFNVIPYLFKVMNIIINESLSRTILTSLTTFIVVVCLFVLGGEIIHDFSFAMLIGIAVGTYSSVFVASPTVLAMAERKRKD